MKQYLELGERVLRDGQWITIGETERLTVYGGEMRFNLHAGFPLVTTKKVWWKGIVGELLWFLNGSTNVKELQAAGIHIWDANARPDGTIGDSYGHQWRNWGGTGLDQIARCIETLERRPKTTRNLVLAWNPLDIGRMALPPCHFSFECLSDGHGLTLVVTMRSTDIALGFPYNVASYALLTHILALRTGLRADSLIMQLGHVHLYKQHFDTFKHQLSLAPYDLPTLTIEGELTPDLKGLRARQFTLEKYYSHPALKYEMVVTT